ncbi:hypothetical protein PDESU_00999 [Pontiella desulfatans]|uniref:Gingipain domain-containing protein n=1 Tax=Pontiella desulfatans TaxID=2750659 RepID=A0A6C2TZ30_PONDE|nr:C25 family cysteine peptidase [Pontiella desulfatans]VGO12446.1 hypothetical protein PDESU_00999 [Pontiella desulfatans]
MKKHITESRARKLRQTLFVLLAFIPAFGTLAQETIVSFPLDDDPGWSTDGLWEFGVPLGIAGDPTTGYTGTNVYGYNLAGAFPIFNAPHWLTTTQMDCSDHVNVELKFKRWLCVDEGPAPYYMAVIQVRSGSSGWATVWYDEGNAIIDTSWVDVSYPIGEVADRASGVQVRWAMGTHDDRDSVWGGWNIDDVMLVGDPADIMDVEPGTDWAATAYVGSPTAPSEAIYTITNISSGSEITWTTTKSDDWLMLTPSNGTLQAGNSTNLTVAIDTTGLAPGTYSATFQISNTNTGNSTTRSVELEIIDPMDVTPATDWETTAYEGSPPAPSFVSYTIVNHSASNVLDWTTTASDDWLSVSPPSGALPPGSSTNAIVAIDTSGLLPGTYAGSVQIENQNSSNTAVRSVGLEVLGVPGQIAILPAGGFVVTNLIGQQQARTLVVSNAAPVGTLDFSIEMQQTGYAPPDDPAPMMAAMVEYSMASESDRIREEYTFPLPVLNSDGEFDHVHVAGLETHLRTGAPMVPVKPVTFAIPAGMEAGQLTVEVLEQIELPGSHHLAPAQTLVIPGEQEPETTPPDPAIYGTAANWPGIDGETVGTYEKRGQRFTTLNLFPLQYNPVSGKITYATRMRVQIDLDGGRAAYATFDEPTSSLPPGGPYKHVIITSSAFEAAPGPWNFQALRDRRTAEGLASTIITTDWIYSNYDGTRPDGGTDNPTKIRNFLIDAYENWGTEYTLLGGAADVVPPRLFRVDHQRADSTNLVPFVDNFPVDMYYGCLSPTECTFDGNTNGFYGEPDDGIGGADVDLYAEVYVGRAPVEDEIELANFVRKTLAYADSTDPCLQRISMAGEALNYGINKYAKTMLEQVRLGGEYDGFFTRSFANHTRGDLPELDTSVNLYDADSTWSKTDLADLVNGGIHVLNGLGHANETRLFKMFTSDLPIFTNQQYCFMYSQACENGAFDTDDCWAEEVVAMPYGAFAAVMNVRFGWGVKDSTYCPSNRFNREFWDSVFGDGKMELGKANQEAKEKLVWDINGPAMRWSYYELTLFGDPAQRLHFPNEPEWLSANPLAADGLRASNSVEVAIQFNAEGVASGSYTGELTVASNDPGNPLQVVPMVMVVLPDDLSIAPDWGIELSGSQGSLALPYDSVYSLTNSGSAPLDWMATGSAFWLETIPASGTLPPFTQTNITVSIAATANALPEGLYDASVTFSNSTSGATFSRPVQLDIDPPAPVGFTTFALDADPGWSTEGGWAFGQPQGQEGDPSSGYTGTNVYGYNLAGAYGNNLPQQWLTTSAINCSGHLNVQLNFRRWLGIEASSNDQATVEISTNAYKWGAAWHPVWAHDGDALTNSSWEEVSYDISAIADGQPTVHIRWSMGATDSTNTYCGWNIDDVALVGEPVVADANSNGIPDWWEYHYFGSNVAANAHGDVDAYDNMAEYIAGTDPSDGNSFFVLSSYSETIGGTNEFILEWHSLEDRYYDIWRSTNLFDGFETWETNLEYPQNTYTDTTHSASNSFYMLDVRMK